MPALDGLEIFHQLRDIVPETPVIMAQPLSLSMRSSATPFARAPKAPVSKPLDFDWPLELIEQATGTSLMVLVVDDDEQLCANLADFTTDLG